ncbi:MAG: type I-U CRISPR-associated protein Csx17 [Gaiellales bacterium]
MLPACRPEPLASYLKSLAVLRLVAEQKDPDARGFWKGDVFHLDSRLTEDGLVRFFLEEYEPTPIVAPWNGGSGFYEGDQMDGIDSIAATDQPRFALYRETIELIRAWEELPPRPETNEGLARRLEAEASRKTGKQRQVWLESARSIRRGTSADGVAKARTKANEAWRSRRKAEIVRVCRSRLPDGAVDWLDAVIALAADGTMRFPPLLGSGGNEGRLDYTNGFMRRVGKLLVEPDGRTESLLRNALFEEGTLGLTAESVGQHDPGHAGGFNQGPGIEHKSVPTNSWNFMLAMEGTISWTSAISRRSTTSGASAPFTVRARAVGFTSASRDDAGKARAEVWTPLWRHPVAYRELKAFLGEGRAEVGGRPARDALEFAQAAASLGVDRGISEFVRYGLLKRRGDNYVALPAGRFAVTARSEADLVRQLDPLLQRLDAFLRQFRPGEPPPRLASHRRAIDERIHHALARGGQSSIKSLLASLGRIERLLAERDRSKDPRLSRPLGGLRPDWLPGAADGSAEVRIAAALASIRPTGKVGPLRANVSPVDPSRTFQWADGRRQVAWRGSSLAERLAGALARRILDAGRLDCPYNPVAGSLPLALDDVATFLEGNVDEGLLEDLMFGFTLLDWHDWKAVRTARDRLREPDVSTAGDLPPTSYCLLKLLFLPGPLRIGDAEIDVRPEPAIVPLLLTDRVGDACRIARRRLFAAGLLPVTAEFPDGEDGARLAAALLLPIHSSHSIARRALVERTSLA